MRRPHALVSRREWLRRSGALGLAPLLPGMATGTASPLPRPEDPSAALTRLIEGNRRFAEGRPLNPDRTLARLQSLSTSQQPFAAVLACSDSRVPVEILFDEGFGDLFVARVAGNPATAEVIGSLEYAAELLGTVVVFVLGHSGCGAVKATMGGTAEPGLIGSLYPYINPAVEDAGAQGIDAVVAENVRNQVDTLRSASPVLAARIRAGTLRVEGGVFDFRTGLVTLVETPDRRLHATPAAHGDH